MSAKFEMPNLGTHVYVTKREMSAISELLLNNVADQLEAELLRLTGAERIKVLRVLETRGLFRAKDLVSKSSSGSTTHKARKPIRKRAKRATRRNA